MGKTKKFIDKKKSATFQLMARDTSDPNYESSDRVFVRVDNNSNYAPESFFNDDDVDHEEDPDARFADADEDEDEDVDGYGNSKIEEDSSLPEHVRREILELGFPDDGYNYLEHLREIKNTGAGSVYYQNPKATFHLLPHDVKAYDASKVDISKTSNTFKDKTMYSVASKSVDVRLQKVLDPEVAALLDDSDSSRFGSDVEDLEEDFVVRANILDETDTQLLDQDMSSGPKSSVPNLDSSVSTVSEDRNPSSVLVREKPRTRRPIDEQFDMLELNEYGSDTEEVFDNYMYEDEDCQDSLTEKLNHAFKNRPLEGLHSEGKEEDDEPPELAAEVIQKCKEYAEKYDNESDNVEGELFEESSDESEGLDCETIVSTYSTLDNHPGKIEAPESRRKKKLFDTIFESPDAQQNQVISLKGKEKLPVDYLPRTKKLVEGKNKDVKDADDKKAELSNRKPRGQESKEEKKERKSAVKLERRQARLVKKEMKGLYKSEANRAQRVAAVTGPSSIHLM